MQVEIPNHVVQNEYPAFPAGHYEGVVSDAQIRDPRGDGSWLLIRLRLTDVQPREGTPDPGRRSFSGDITLRNTDKDGNVLDLRVVSEVNGSTPRSLQRGAGLIAGLAAAAGLAERTANGLVVDLDYVVSELLSDQMNGLAVAFTVTNRTDKNGKLIDELSVIGPV